jgi:putative ATPase
MGEQLRAVCDRIYATLQPQRHHILLDLNAGLLTWEALRQVPEGGVYACASTSEIYTALTEQAQALTDLARPIYFLTPLTALSKTLTIEASDIVFDGIVGRNALKTCTDRQTLLRQLAQHLGPSGRIVLAETIPFRTLRLYSLLPKQTLPTKLFKKLQQTEESLYTSDPHKYWDMEAISSWFEGTGFEVEVELITLPAELAVTHQLQSRWFGKDSRYMQHLAKTFSAKELATIRQAYVRELGTNVAWETTVALITGVPI